MLHKEKSKSILIVYTLWKGMILNMNAIQEIFSLIKRIFNKEEIKKINTANRCNNYNEKNKFAQSLKIKKKKQSRNINMSWGRFGYTKENSLLDDI